LKNGNFPLLSVQLMELGAVMKIFSFIENLIPFSVLLKFKICKVGGMHSYEWWKRRGGGRIWTCDDLDKWIGSQSCTYKGHINTQAKKSCLFLGALHMLNLAPVLEHGIPWSDSTLIFKMLKTLSNKPFY
jgi:hypothetical protein